MKKNRNGKNDKLEQIKIENPDTKNSQIPAPLYVNKTGKWKQVLQICVVKS